MESFVCEGEYRLGLDRILSAFLTNISQPQQQAVWVSGFYGSGKSHLVRVLEHLWRDVEFPDGARARSVATLPSDIDANLIELSRGWVGRKAASGRQRENLIMEPVTVRLALLAVLFRSAGLPEQYPAARLVLWLMQNGWYDAVSGAVQSQGKTLDSELRNMYVSSVLAQSLLEVVPDLASNARDIHALLREQYPNVSDISDDELHSSISRRALAPIDRRRQAAAHLARLRRASAVHRQRSRADPARSERRRSLRQSVRQPHPFRWHGPVGAPGQHGALQASGPILNHV